MKSRQEIPPQSVDRITASDMQRMPLLSAQQKLDEERGIRATPRECLEGGARLGTGGPEWLVKQIAEVQLRALDMMGFEIVAKVAKRE